MMATRFAADTLSRSNSGRVTPFRLVWLVVVIGAAGSRVEAQVVDTAQVRSLPALTVEGVRQRTIAPPVATRAVDSLALRKTLAEDAWDLVRRTTGIEIHEQGQGPGFAANTVIRGFTSDHSADLLLTIDGVPINLPLHGHIEGYSDWNALFPAAANGLRIIHGPSSPLYGDFAFGGVVEVSTPWAAPRPSASIGGSTFGDANGWFRVGQRSGNRGWVAAGRVDRTQGWRDHSSYWLGNGFLKGRTPVGRGSVEGGLLWYGSSWDSPGFVSVTDYNARRLRQAGDLTDGGHASRIVGHGRYDGVAGDHLGVSVLTWFQSVNSQVFLNIPEGDARLRQSDERDRRIAVGGEAQFNWHTGLGEVALGVSGRTDDLSYRLRGSEARVPVDSEAVYDGVFRSAGVFSRWRYLWGSVALDWGLRVDHLRYQSTDLLAGTVARIGSATLVSPKLGARYLINGELAVLGSLSRGFKGAPGVISDPTRAPQRLWAKEVGVEWAPGRSRVRLSAFRFNVTGERVQDPITREISGAGRSVRQGLDLDLETALGRSVVLNAAVTVNDARISERLGAPTPSVVFDRLAGEGPSFHLAPIGPGEAVPGVSRYLVRLGGEVAVDRRLTLDGVLRVNGPYTPIGEPTVRTRPYALIDLAGSRVIGGSRWTVDVELQNLLNSRYQEIRSSRFLNPGSPRAARVAIRFQ